MPDCDCDKILVSATNEKIQFADVVFSPKWEDQILTETKNDLLIIPIQSSVGLNISTEETVQGFPDSCFHPPSIS